MPRRRPLRSGELYCLPCHGPKRPAGAMVDFLPDTPTSGTLRGMCPDCHRLMHRKVNRTSLDKVTAGLDVAFPNGEQRISDTADPLVNVHFETGDKAR